jgi:hypothetical protein
MARLTAIRGASWLVSRNQPRSSTESELRRIRSDNAQAMAIWFAQHRAGMTLEHVREQLGVRSYSAVASILDSHYVILRAAIGASESRAARAHKSYAASCLNVMRALGNFARGASRIVPTQFVGSFRWDEIEEPATTPDGPVRPATGR